MSEQTSMIGIPGQSFENRKRLILIVEDEFVNRELLNAYLEDEYDILFAETGAAAMEAIRSHLDTLSLVLLDLILPDLNGLEILRRIKKDIDLSRIPVIVLTSDKDSEVDSLNSGANDFISKPYPRHEIIRARIRRCIELADLSNKALVDAGLHPAPGLQAPERLSRCTNINNLIPLAGGGIVLTLECNTYGPDFETIMEPNFVVLRAILKDALKKPFVDRARLIANDPEYIS